FFSSRRRHTRFSRDWSSDVCSSDLEAHQKGQPVLVGTTSVEKSDAISRLLEKRSVPHNVLNAKQHEREAYIVAQAGMPGAVTVEIGRASCRERVEQESEAGAKKI